MWTRLVFAQTVIICTYRIIVHIYFVLFAALQLGGADILNGDFEFFSPGSYIVAAEGFDFLYNRSSSSGVDVAFIDGPLSEQLLIRVSY